MKKLLSSLKLKNLTLPNKVILSPMCQYSATDGFANDWHLIHLGQYAIGRAGAIIQEATAITPEGRITYADLGIWSDDHIAKYKEITSFIKQQGSIPGIQLAHAGRKASCDKPWISRNQISPQQLNGWQTVSSSDIPFLPNDVAPLKLSTEQINELINDFKQATIRALKAGYQIIEIHAAHGYLIHQFLSPLINNRTDIYGGSFENRIRFLTQIIQEIKPLLCQESLWVRISALDWAKDGWDLEQSIRLSQVLEQLGVEVIDVSSGGAVSWQEIKSYPGYQVPFAKAIKENTKLTVGAVGLITQAKQAQEILDSDQADFILLGREFLRNPHFVAQAAKELNQPVTWPKQYARSIETK
ncbi:NADH:flavin oxidoreductase/NADH oxidase [Myroides sp. LJL110]